MKVGWIGLGQMGLPTAATIAAAGHAVRGFDVNPPALGLAGAVQLVGSVAEAAQDCDLLCIAVFSDEQVEDVLTGPEGVMGQLKPGAVVAVFTTGAIEFIQSLAAAAPAGVTVLDTCFSRKQSEVASGRLTLLIGGDGDAIERARPALETFARTIFHVGGSGAGRAIKLVNNVLFAAHAQVAADALKLAEGLGLDRSKTAAALMECSGASDIMNNFVVVEPAAMLENIHRYMVKDVAAALDAGANANVELGPLQAATAVYLK
jgi:3-hydroxyisobutyrate dehydrogenase-like beta-hydroxyacid dehydrogenase